MKILFVIRSLDSGGAERQLTLLAQHLAERGHHVNIAVMYSGGLRETDLVTGKVNLIDLNKRSRFDMFGVMLRLRALISDLKPDIVHGYLSAGNIAALTARISSGRSKVIWALRDSNMDMNCYGAMTRCASAVAAFFSHQADGIIANSAAGREFSISNGYPSERTIYVANGIDVAKFYPHRTAGSHFRASLGFGEPTKLIGLVARMDPMKDHQTFLTAASLVAAVRTDVRFVCVGGGGSSEYTRSLEKLAFSLGLGDRIKWLSFASDMCGVYSGLDVFCLSSQFGEGFPNVLGEAMACARPCVTTNVGDAAYVAGDCAQIVPPRDPGSLANAIVANLERGERREARERIVQNFSVTQMVLRTERALEGWAGLAINRTHVAAVSN